VTLEEEITELTAKWQMYVSLDHHKDRDCHWFIQKTWSYGEEPYYEAYHSGYILDHWTSPRCGSAEMASTILRDKLKRELDSAVMSLKDAITNPESLEWLGITQKDAEKLIKKISN
jgi:hypothetical protein